MELIFVLFGLLGNAQGPIAEKPQEVRTSLELADDYLLVRKDSKLPESEHCKNDDSKSSKRLSFSEKLICRYEALFREIESYNSKNSVKLPYAAYVFKCDQTQLSSLSEPSGLNPRKNK